MIGIFGAGVVGSRVAESLSLNLQTEIGVFDSSQIIAQRLARRLHPTNSNISAVDENKINSSKVVVIAGPSPHAEIARAFLEKKISVVSTSDDIADCLNLLAL